MYVLSCFHSLKDARCNVSETRVDETLNKDTFADDMDHLCILERALLTLVAFRVSAHNVFDIRFLFILMQGKPLGNSLFVFLTIWSLTDWGFYSTTGSNYPRQNLSLSRRPLRIWLHIRVLLGSCHIHWWNFFLFASWTPWRFERGSSVFIIFVFYLCFRQFAAPSDRSNLVLFRVLFCRKLGEKIGVLLPQKYWLYINCFFFFR